MIAIGALLLAGMTASATAQESTPAAVRPNIVIVLADDLGWNDVGYHGGEIRTPQINRLGKAGVRLERFYVQPTCSASRAALLTGRYPFRYGLQSADVQPWDREGLPAGEELLPEALLAAGYRTALIGKWHLGASTADQLPLSRGFEYHYGPYLGAIDYFSKRRLGGLDWHRNGESITESGYVTELLTADAESWIASQSSDQPFFLMVAFTAPHPPIHDPPPPPSKGSYSQLKRQRARYAAMVTHLDAAIGRIWGTLKARGMADRTLFIFASDNGGGTDSGADNRPLRGGAGSYYDGGLRVPAFALWPETLPSGEVREELLHIVDVFPTLLALAGSEVNAARELDGVDVWRTLQLAEPPARSDLVLQVEPGRGILINDSYKLIRNGERASERSVRVTLEDAADELEIFELYSDPSEQRNLVLQEPDRVRDMRARLLALEAEAAEPLGSGRSRQPPGFSPPLVWGDATQRVESGTGLP